MSLSSACRISAVGCPRDSSPVASKSSTKLFTDRRSFLAADSRSPHNEGDRRIVRDVRDSGILKSSTGMIPQ